MPAHTRAAAYGHDMTDDMSLFYALPKADQERLLRDPHAPLSPEAAERVRDTPAEGWTNVDTGETHLHPDVQDAVRARRESQ